MFLVDPALVLPHYFSLVTGITGKAFSWTRSLMIILDKNRLLRAKITADGSVTDPEGTLVGFLNEDGSAGDDRERFLGEITQDCRVINKLGKEISKLDETGLTISENNTIIAKVNANGDLYDEKQQYCGVAEFYTTRKFRMISGYLLFFDLGLIKSRSLSLVVRNLELEEQLEKERKEAEIRKKKRKRKIISLKKRKD